jgi:hypothetical protein
VTGNTDRLMAALAILNVANRSTFSMKERTVKVQNNR